MPAGLSAVGKRTPLGWMLEELKAILFGRATAPGLAAAFLVLALAVLVLAFAARARLAGAFARS
jgi:hypothetical protein